MRVSAFRIQKRLADVLVVDYTVSVKRVASSRLFSGFIALALACQQAACTSHASVPIENPREALVPQRGLIRLVDSDGSIEPIAPESNVSFVAKDGSLTDSVQAGLLCRTEQGLSVRASASESCASAIPLIDWDAIDSVQVDTFDGAATTAVVAGIVIVIAAVAFALAVSGKGKGNATTPPSGRTPAQPTTGTAPTGTPPTGGNLPPVVAEGPHTVTGGNVVIVTGPRAGFGYGYGYGYRSSGSRPDDDDGTLFTRTDLRRSRVRGVIGLDGGVCVFSPGSCFTSGLRGGVRLFNFAELTLGFRTIQGWGVHDYPRITPVLGVGLHGELPGFRWFSLEVAGQVGRTSAIDFYANMLLGFRISPAPHLWIGVFPIHPAYVAWSGGRGNLWTAQSSLDLSVDF